MRWEAAGIRREWLEHALSTRPADRPAAEAAISGLYRLAGLKPPRFHWVSSPLIAMETVPPGIRLRPGDISRPGCMSPASTSIRQLSSARAELGREIDEQVRKARWKLYDLVSHEVAWPFSRSVSALPSPEAGGWRLLSSAWSETSHLTWVARSDALCRVGGVLLSDESRRQLGMWAKAARSCGGWWPHEGVCVVSERPDVLRTEVWGDHDEVRLHCEDGPAVRYADGWETHAWHGTRVPSWVIDDPSAERIEREPNVEVRRCAIERIGWPEYVEQAGLRLLGATPDPGNPGSELRLYDMQARTRVLIAVNGSLERDGRRRRYGLTVPGHLADPVAAAGWTYGLSAEQYSLLARRT